MSMLKNIETYREFLKKQKEERESFLEIVSTKIVDGLTDYIKDFGWVRKGNGGGLSGDKIKGVKYTKTFNGKEVVIEYRNNLRLNIDGRLHFSNGLNEFVHDKSFSQLIRKFNLSVDYFNWNGADEYSGWDLDTIIKHIEKFYSKNLK